MSKTYIGIDNGVTGTVGFVRHGFENFVTLPTKKQQDYTKQKQNITRVDVAPLKEILNDNIEDLNNCFAFIERPMVNPKRWKATVSALRCLEAWLIILEDMQIGYDFLDSKEWQRELLPKGVKGTEELKNASKDIGCRMYPLFGEIIVKHKDADAILIAEYCRRKFS